MIVGIELGLPTGSAVSPVVPLRTAPISCRRCPTLPAMTAEPNNHGGLLLVISGPSGVGKTTITRQVEQRLGGVFSVSATTRPRTASEVDGQDYHFLTEQQFQEKVDRAEFLEHAQVYGKYRYGTLQAPVQHMLSLGRLVLLDIDVQGGMQVRQAAPDAFMLFILPPGDEELLRRLRQRGREGESSIQHRFNEAKHEIELAMQSGAYDAHIVNEDFEQAVEEACRLIQRRRAVEQA